MEERLVTGISKIKRLNDGRYIATRADGVNFCLTPEQWRDVSDEIWRREFESDNPNYDRA